jgi:hypothetical protein
MRPVRAFLTAFGLFVLGLPLVAQDPPLVAGLRAPMEMAFTHQGNIIVSETGMTPNSGRLSLVDRTSGARRTLIEGLPSGLHVMGATSSPSGPSGLALQGSTLYFTVGNGDSVMAGPLPGTEQPNPNPSSPILSSLLAIQTSVPLDQTAGGFVLEPSHHARLKSGETLTLQNGTQENATIRLVADFPDYTAEPRPDFAANVRLANTFGVAAVGQTLYVVDASQNAIYRVDANTGAYTTLTTFAKVANPTPVGAPVIDAVPNSVRVRGNELLVTLLTGFPFPAGKAEVRRVNLTTGAHEPLIGNLSSALDSAPLGNGPQAPMLVVEFSTNQMQSAPGRLLLATPGSTDHTLVAANLITPTSVLVDRRNGDVFISLLGPGLIRRINAAALIPIQRAGSVIAVAGSTAGAYASQFRTAAQVSNPNPFAISGSFVFQPVSGASRQLGYTLAPYQTRSYADLAGDIGVSGIGSIDVVPAVGPVPAMVVRIVEQSSACKPSAQVPQLAREAALTTGASGTVITHVDDAAQRFNVGVRALEEGATVTATLYGTNGSVRATVTHSIAPNALLHTGGSDLMGMPVHANESIVFKVTAGSAIIYGSTANNDGTGMTVQVAAGN